MIQEPLQRLHQRGLPSWYPEIEACIDKLVNLGAQICQYPDATEAKHKIHAISEGVRPFDTINLLVRTHLIRGARDDVTRRCDIGSLSLALGLIDSWLRSCEEYVQRNNNKRIEGDGMTFDDVNRELSALAKPHLINKCRPYDNLLDLFDNLGLTKPGDSEDHDE